MLTHRHSSNAFSEDCPDRTLELVEMSKSWQPIVLEKTIILAGFLKLHVSPMPTTEASAYLLTHKINGRMIQWRYNAIAFKTRVELILSSYLLNPKYMNMSSAHVKMSELPWTDTMNITQRCSSVCVRSFYARLTGNIRLSCSPQISLARLFLLGQSVSATVLMISALCTAIQFILNIRLPLTLLSLKAYVIVIK